MLLTLFPTVCVKSTLVNPSQQVVSQITRVSSQAFGMNCASSMPAECHCHSLFEQPATWSKFDGTTKHNFSAEQFHEIGSGVPAAGILTVIVSSEQTYHTLYSLIRCCTLWKILLMPWCQVTPDQRQTTLLEAIGKKFLLVFDSRFGRIYILFQA